MHFCVYCAHMYAKVVKVVLIFTLFFAHEDFHFPGLIILRFFQCVSTSLFGFRTMHLTVSIPETYSIVTFLWLFSEEGVFQVILQNTFEDHPTFVCIFVLFYPE